MFESRVDTCLIPNMLTEVIDCIEDHFVDIVILAHDDDDIDQLLRAEFGDGKTMIQRVDDLVF